MRTVRSGQIVFGLLMTILVLGGSGNVRADILTYTETGTFSLYSGADSLGLNGASFSVTETVDSAATPVSTHFNSINGVYSALYNTMSTSFTITGASVSSTNGTYTTPLQLSVSNGPNSSAVGLGTNIGDIGGDNVTIGGVFLPTGTIDVTTHAIPTAFSSSAVQSFAMNVVTYPGNSHSYYNVLDGSASGTARTVPEPSSLVLVVSAFPAIAAIFWRTERRRRAVRG